MFWKLFDGAFLIVVEFFWVGGGVGTAPILAKKNETTTKTRAREITYDFFCSQPLAFGEQVKSKAGLCVAVRNGRAVGGRLGDVKELWSDRVLGVVVIATLGSAFLSLSLLVCGWRRSAGNDALDDGFRHEEEQGRKNNGRKKQGGDVRTPSLLMEHHDLWFADGNVVLAAPTAAFCVHRGILARHSPVLAAALAALDHTLPRLRLALDVPPDDLACFLYALYDGVSTLRYGPSDFDLVSALLRLATKFQAQKIRDDVLRGLSHSWPSTLAQWEIREAAATSPNGLYKPRLSYPHPIMVINLARETDAPELLPSAFYDLCRCPPSDIAAGYTCPRSSRHHSLSPEDLMRIFKGKEHASRYLSTFVVNELEGRQPSATCIYMAEKDPVRRRTCQAAFEAITFEILRDVNGVVCHRSSDPLFAIVDAELMQTRQDSSFAPGISLRACEHCRAEFAAIVDAVREEFWNKLPLWFGLQVPNWPA